MKIYKDQMFQVQIILIMGWKLLILLDLINRNMKIIISEFQMVQDLIQIIAHNIIKILVDQKLLLLIKEKIIRHLKEAKLDKELIAVWVMKVMNNYNEKLKNK